MSKRKAIAGLAVLCVLALSAISAAGASAAGSTAYTCVKGTPAEFSNAHCSSASGTREWRHEAFGTGTSTHLLVAATTNQILKTELLAVEVELEGTAVEALTAHSKIENTEEAGVMHAGGTIKLKYNNVVVKKPAAGCEVEDITNGLKGVVTTETLTFKSNAAREIEFFPPASGIFAQVKIVGCILANTYNVEGSISGTTSGATLSTSAATSNLTLGGEPASLTGTVEISGTDTAKPTVTNPLALT